VRRIFNILRLATRDYLHEWQMSGCFVLALAAVLGPMMVLFGLKFGIVGSMLQDLVQDPRNREIHPVTSGHYKKAWLDQLSQRPDVAFAIPLTRSIAATIRLKSNSSPRILSVEMIPTAKGEPLFEPGAAVPVKIDEIVLSAEAARKLNVKVGDQVDGSLSRRFAGHKERVHLPLKVVGVARPRAFGRDGAFVTLAMAEAAEDFRDGHAVPDLGWKGDIIPDDVRTYPGFRLYASSIYDVSSLRDELAAQGLDVRTRSEDIDIVQRMDHNLTFVFWAIAVIGLFGFALSLGASLWANVDRKRRELSVLRLVGFRTGDIVWFPVIQSLYTAVLGWGLAALIYQGVASTINRMLGGQLANTQEVCRLLPDHYLIALGLTVGSAIFAAILAGLRSARIEPSEGLREI